ncbi:carbonate dehydratase [Paenibacillus pectinilyticus]|uniref:Carbonate dehydratase n=1 Tax=Paenibacillus pectinilyticus TaxID=512399 RepID=A0A1C1A0X3_9BACL|nr:carbonate dehydratase [Paenibacillus pectinilyticus]OCT14197.1 carbonate dehydratase [Paenibacillus pectinilyticus]
MDNYPEGPYNYFIRFISSNPATSFNQQAVHPRIDPSAFVGPFSSVIGDVTIASNVFIAPSVSIRADEGTPFYIGEGTNLQDGAILHGLKDAKVIVNEDLYAIFIDRSVTIAHGAIVHGPVFIGRGSFVGFQSLVFQAVVGNNVYISNNAVVIGKVSIADDRFIPPGAIIDTQEKADRLSLRPKDAAEFAKEVIRINRDFSSSYALAFGEHRCSCGLACNL